MGRNLKGLSTSAILLFPLFQLGSYQRVNFSPRISAEENKISLTVGAAQTGGREEQDHTV